MKNSQAALAMMLMGSMLGGGEEDVFNITGRGKVHKNAEKEPTPKKVIPFHKQENIAKMISDYKLIKLGQSKKGKLKQARIVNTIEKFLKLGSITENHLK